MEIEMNTLEMIQIFEKVKLAKQRYTQQKCAADQRGIDWLYTFDTWWNQWIDSGHWEQRGNKNGQYCMARKGDVGPYSPDNVDIILAIQNSSDGRKGKPGPWKGKKLPPEMVEAIRIRATGVKQSDETRKKKSDANKGKPWSEARRAAHKGAWNKGLKLVK